MIKSLKFESHLADLILSGQKTTTWRLFDDKDISIGDSLELIRRPELTVFAHAVVTNVYSLPFSQVGDKELIGHENPYSSRENMYDTYSSYYHRPVNDQTSVKIITSMFFSFLDVNKDKSPNSIFEVLLCLAA